MRSRLVDGERHAIGRFRRSAAAVYAAGGAGIGHVNFCRTGSRGVRVWNCGRQLGSVMGGGQCRAVPIDGRISVKVGAADR